MLLAGPVEAAPYELVPKKPKLVVEGAEDTFGSVVRMGKRTVGL
jgi:hypothetical protein